MAHLNFLKSIHIHLGKLEGVVLPPSQQISFRTPLFMEKKTLVLVLVLVSVSCSWCPITLSLEFFSFFEPPKVASMARLLRNISFLTRSLFVPKVRFYAFFFLFWMLSHGFVYALWSVVFHNFCHQRHITVLSSVLCIIIILWFWWPCLSRFNFFS